MELRQATSGTCLALAYERLELRAIKDNTYRSYLQTLRALEIEDLPIEKATVRELGRRLSTVITQSTRRKHAVNLQACLGIKVPTPAPKQKVYDLPTVQEVREAFADSKYRPHVYGMTFAGMRIGESLVNQPLKGKVINIDRQRTPQNEITPAKTTGPVIVPDWFAEEYATYQLGAINHATVYRGVKRKAKKELGIELNPHALRHLFATTLVAAGVSPNILKAQMRHHDVAVSLRYYVQHEEKDIASAVASVFG
ncbi:tyrosine-type recombinase/integrase [Streptomyces sp. NPDC102451]|uniref:tyrosine-type recombinase/integrase n=1 Tax=Streptomyces sp. NPDC102451 TaxID=3366177 RepID=UPI00381EA51A